MRHNVKHRQSGIISLFQVYLGANNCSTNCARSFVTSLVAGIGCKWMKLSTQPVVSSKWYCKTKHVPNKIYTGRTHSSQAHHAVHHRSCNVSLWLIQVSLWEYRFLYAVLDQGTRLAGISQ